MLNFLHKDGRKKMYKYNAGDSAPYHPNTDKDDKDRCIVCGKPTNGKIYGVEVVDGGNLKAQDGTPAAQDGGYMGWWSVGSSCAKLFAPELLVKN